MDSKYEANLFGNEQRCKRLESINLLLKLRVMRRINSILVSSVPEQTIDKGQTLALIQHEKRPGGGDHFMLQMFDVDIREVLSDTCGNKEQLEAQYVESFIRIMKEKGLAVKFQKPMKCIGSLRFSLVVQ